MAWPSLLDNLLNWFLVVPVEPVNELDNTSTDMVDDIVLLDSTNNEDGVSFTLGIMLEVTEVYKIVGDCNTEEELDTEGVSSNEDKRDDDATDVMVISTPLLDVEMVIGEVNEASLRGNGVDDKCLVVVGCWQQNSGF